MNILALSVAHDSSVCLINNGKIDFFCKEERLTRVKRDKNPLKSIDLFKSLNFAKPDHVLFVTPSNTDYEVEAYYRQYFKKIFNLELENYSNLLHHKCHASLAFYNSGFKNALVFVVDRNGSMFFQNGRLVAREAESVFTCSYPSNINPIYKSFSLETIVESYKEYILQEIKNFYKDVEIQVNPFGIVKAYEAATTLIGQDALENGKTMGLSAYGKNQNYDPLFVNGQAITNFFSEVINPEQNGQVCFFGEKDKILSEVTKENYQYYANKAKQVQLQTQQEVLDLIKKYTQQTGIKDICIVGGYGLNVVANNYYIKNLSDINFYFEPVADDTGISIGAAMLKYRELSKDASIITLDNNFYHYYKNEDFFEGNKATINDICSLLMQQKSVAIFEGNPEVGPRALGHRSILFDPRNKNGKDLINKVKKREWYRPFAGVILESQFADYFDTLGLEKSEYMTINFTAKDITKELAPSIVHVDGTCRMQTVSNGFLFDLLTEFYKQTGCPMLLNTSFNLAGEPLVQTKIEAHDVFKNSCLDAVYFVDNQTILQKE